METIVEKFILQLEAQLAERQHRDHARAGRAALARAEGLRPGLRRAAARARHPDGGAGSADRRDPVRPARARRDRDDWLEERNLAFGFEARTPAPRASEPSRPTRMSTESAMGQRSRDSRKGRRPPLVGAAGRRQRARAAASASKPTYVEELERQLAEKDRIAQEYIANTGRPRPNSKNHACGSDGNLEGHRAGTARDPGGSARGRGQPRSRARCRRQSPSPERCSRASRWSSASSWRSSEGSA